MFYKVLLLFFIILLFLFGCLIFIVHDRHHRPILCSKLTEAKWTCEKEADCPVLHELVKDYEIHHCGGDKYESKICCPPHTPHEHRHEEVEIPSFKTKHIHADPDSIVRQKCQEYIQYSFINQTIESQLPDDKPIFHQVSECVEIEPLLVGGVNATEEEFPHMVLLGFGENMENAKWECGGTLISEQFILTAAHCTPLDAKMNESWALFGILSRLNASSNKLDKNIFRVGEHFIHPEYDETKKLNDIALYKLATPIKFTPTIRPVCLFTTSEMSTNETSVMSTNTTNKDDTKASVIGWGSYGPGLPSSDNLLKTTVHILSNEACESDTTLKGVFVSESMICAGDLDESKDTCVGDSGGPLQIPTPGSECMWTQIGINVNGKTKCGNGHPALYVKVAHYIPWIQKTVWP